MGSAVLVAVVVLSGKSANLAIKAQYIILVAIAAALVSLLLGKGANPPQEITWLQPAGLGITAVSRRWPETGSRPGSWVAAAARPTSRGSPWP